MLSRWDSNFPMIRNKLNKHAPFKKFRTKNRYSPWFTPDLTALDQHKNTPWCTALDSKSPHDMQLFREVRNQYTQSVRKAKASFFKQKKFWDTVKSMEKNLDPYKSAGLDNLDPLFLKLSAAIVATPITRII